MSYREMGSPQERASSSCPLHLIKRPSPGHEGAFHSPRLLSSDQGTGFKIPRSLPAWVSIYPELWELFLNLPSNLILATYSKCMCLGDAKVASVMVWSIFGRAWFPEVMQGLN